MPSNHHDQLTIKEYLLGQLNEESRHDFEQRLLSDDGLFEELLFGEDELIDQYLAGELNENEIEMLEKTFLVTSARQQKLSFARVFRTYSTRHRSDSEDPAHRIQAASAISSSPVTRKWTLTFFSSPWTVAAFAVLILGAAIGVWRIYFHQSDLDKGLIALNAAYREQRPIEARITELDYAPFASTRGPEAESVNQSELRRAELTLLEALDKNPTSAVHYGLGKVYLAKHEWDRSIQEFNEALRGDPKNPLLYSDLGAAYLEKAKIDLGRARANPSTPESGKGMENIIRSLESLNRALDLKSDLPEALFNRALVYEQMVLPQQAEEDWKRYLNSDHNSKWADEAKRHLSDLKDKKRAKSQDKAELLVDIVAAHESKSEDRAYELISRNTEAIAGQLVWWQLVGAYLDATLKPEKVAVAHSYLDALAYAGKLQQERTGDPFVSEMVSYYESCGTAERSVLAVAHATIDEGHVLMSKSEAAEALKRYQAAKTVFDKAGDKWESAFADYWIGYSYQRLTKFEESLSSLSRLAEYCQSRNYLWLFEKAVTMIGLIHGELNQFSLAIGYQNQALETSKKINDVYNTQKNLTMLAYDYKNLGNHDQALGYIQRSLQSASNYWPGPRQMYRNYYATGGILNSFGYYPAAAEYEKAALSLAQADARDPAFEHQCYVSLAAIYGKLGDYQRALLYAESSYKTAKEFDNHTSARPVAESLLQLGHIKRLAGSFDESLSEYDEAVTLFDSLKLFAFLYEARKGQLLADIARHNDAKAKEELPKVLALFEEHRSKIREERNRNSFFDLEQSVYDIAIDFEYSRMKDYEKAYDYSEVSRARSLLDAMNSRTAAAHKINQDVIIPSVAQPLTLQAIRKRMPEHVQLLQYAVLDDKLLAWVISKDKVSAAERKIGANNLTELVVSYSKLLSTGSGSETEAARSVGIQLYDILIKPVESMLEKDKVVCVVPDKVLNSLSFNALISSSTDKYLINDYTLTFAPSANIFMAASEQALQRSQSKEEKLLSVGDPHFDRDAFPELHDLPSSSREAEEIGGFYKSSCVLVGDQATEQKVRSEMDRADVVHIATHYVVDEHDPMLSKLLLARASGNGGKNGSDGILQAYEIFEHRLPITRLVVLSACQSGVERYYSGEGMIGMSRTFLGAGVPVLAATLWPVASDPTAHLMTAFHRYRRNSNLSTANALRHAQLDMLNDARHLYVQPYYWAPFIVIGGYATF
jgi:CHAT domain-containing protein